MKTAATREPFLITLLIVCLFYGIVQHRQHAAAFEAVTDMRQRISRNMMPLVQRYTIAPDVALLAGVVCGSNDCSQELVGWQWAIARRVSHQRDCYAADRPQSLYISGGCETYVEAMHFPMMSDN